MKLKSASKELKYVCILKNNKHATNTNMKEIVSFFFSFFPFLCHTYEATCLSPSYSFTATVQVHVSGKIQSSGGNVASMTKCR